MSGIWDMMKQAKQMQSRLEEVQEKLAAEKVEGAAGGGMVTAVMNGQQTLLSLSIDPTLVDPNDLELVEELVVAAVNNAREKDLAVAQEKMSALTRGILPEGLAGLKLPGLD